MTDLSPAAQAVLDAVLQKSNLSPTVPVAAAALRAAVHQLNTKMKFDKGVHWVRMELLAIADELEANETAV